MLVMRRAAQLSFCVSIFVLFSQVVRSESPADAPDKLSKQVASLLAKNCLACHNVKKAEGGLSLESHEALMRGGDTGMSVSLETPAESYLLARVIGVDESLMPPEDNAVDAKRLTEPDIELLRQWIQQGAKLPDTDSMPTIEWKKIPSDFKPTYAMAASPDGNYLAYGRANDVVVVTKAASANPRFQNLIDANLVSQPTNISAAHLDLVQSIAFSPDSQRIATGGYRTAKIWKRKTSAAELLAGLAPTDGPISITEDGSRIACASANGSIDLVDVGRRQSHRILQVHPSAVVAMAWWQAGSALISIDNSGRIRQTTWDGFSTLALNGAESDKSLQATALVATANRLFVLDSNGQVSELTIVDAAGSEPPHSVLRPLDGLADVVRMAAGRTDAPVLAVVRSDHSLDVVRVDSGEKISNIKQESPVQFLTLSHDASLVAAISENGASSIWRTKDSQLVAKLDQDYAQSQQLRVAQRDVDRQQAWLAVLDKQLPELKSAAEKEVEAKNKVQEARDKAATALAESVTANDAALASVAESELSLVAARKGLEEAMKRVETLVAEVDSKKKMVTDAESKKKTAEAELSKRDQALATANESSERAAAQIPQHEMKTSSEREILVGFQNNLSSLQATPIQVTAVSLEFSKDTSNLVVIGADQPIRVFEAETGLPIANLADQAELPRSSSISNSNQLISLGQDGILRSWDLDMPWELERTLGGTTENPLSDRVTALDFSPDGQCLAIGSGPPSRFGDVKVFEVTTGNLVADFGQVHSDTVLGLRYSPDGRHIATAGADRLCRLFETSSHQLVRSFEGHTHHILGVAWKDDGQTLATASADNTVKTWNVTTGEQKRTISDFPKEVTSVQFVGQTARIVTTDADGLVRIHNSDDGKQERALTGATNALYAAALSPNNLSVSAAGQAGLVWMWSLADGKLSTTLAVPASSSD